MTQRVWAKEQRSCWQLQRTRAQGCSSSRHGGRRGLSRTLRHTAHIGLRHCVAQHAAAHNTTCTGTRSTHRQILTTRQVLGSSCRPAATSCCNRHHKRGAMSSCSCCCREATHAMWHGLPEAQSVHIQVGTSPLQHTLALPQPRLVQQRPRSPVPREACSGCMHQPSTVSARAAIHVHNMHDSPARQQPPVSQSVSRSALCHTHSQPQLPSLNGRVLAGAGVVTGTVCAVHYPRWLAHSRNNSARAGTYRKVTLDTQQKARDISHLAGCEYDSKEKCAHPRWV
jgi:hypothetical protein